MTVDCESWVCFLAKMDAQRFTQSLADTVPRYDHNSSLTQSWAAYRSLDEHG